MRKELFVIGLISILGQVAMLRELNVAFYGIELIYILAMGLWLFGSGCGAFFRAHRNRDSSPHTHTSFLIFACLLPLELILIRSVRLLLGGVPGTFLSFEKQGIAVFFILMPVSALPGLMFRQAAESHIRRGGTLAGAYAVECLGGAAGGFCAALFPAWGLSNLKMALFCAMTGLIPFFCSKTKRARHLPAFLICAVLGLGTFSSDAIDTLSFGWNHPHLLAAEDTPYGRIVITRRDGLYAVFENDALSFETQGAAGEELIHLAALQHPAPGKVLVSGGEAGGLVAELRKHHAERIEYTEINSRFIRLIDRHLPEAWTSSLSAENVHVHHADPRRFLKTAGGFDLIISGAPEPSSGQTNRFFTREYFQQCADALSPEGIFAFRLPSSENIWSRTLGFRNGAVYHALKSVFQDVMVLPGTSSTIIASRTPLEREPEILIRRFEERNLRTRLISPAFIRYLFTNDRFAEIRDRLESEKTPPNTDARPVCYPFTGLIWLSQFFPTLIHKDMSRIFWNDFSFRLHGTLFFAVLTGLSIVFRWMRKRLKWRGALLAGTAGFTGMALETLLILHYQAKSGALFMNIGMLLMIFMAGMTAGAYGIGRFDFVKKRRRQTGYGILILFCLLAAAIGLFCLQGYAGDLFSVSVLMGGTGFLVSALFAYAGTEPGEDLQPAVSVLYAADVMGGCLGSVAGSLVLAPFFGMGLSALMIGGLILAGLALI